eukprot:5379659-Pyramimonas_sp.AAC.1
MGPEGGRGSAAVWAHSRGLVGFALVLAWAPLVATAGSASGPWGRFGSLRARVSLCPLVASSDAA